MDKYDTSKITLFHIAETSTVALYSSTLKSCASVAKYSTAVTINVNFKSDYCCFITQDCVFPMAYFHLFSIFPFELVASNLIKVK